LPFELVPHTTRLFADYLNDFPKVRQFYSRPPVFREWVADESRRLRYDGERRRRVADVLERQNRQWGASQKALDSLASFRAGAAAVVTGQQVGLFGGPLFSILKAFTAVRLAADATAAGIPCVPVFWLATEDHDLAEINHVTLPAADDAVQTLTTDAHGAENSPVGTIQLGQGIEVALETAAGLLGASEVTDILRESYRPDETLGSAFARLFARLFRDWGVILLDAADPELHAIATPVYRAAALGAADIDNALFERGKALHAAGYHEQVKVTPSSTLLFCMRDGARVPVHRADGQFTINSDRLAPPDLLARIAAAPHEFSANVLLRPVVQDYLLPTLAYTGGPAEVAYFAQAAVVYEELLSRITPVLPRFSATVVEPHAARLLQEYKLALTDLFPGEEHVRELIATRSLPAGLESGFEQAEAVLDAALQHIRESLQQLDPTLVGAEERAASKMRYQLRRLLTRAARAELRRNQEITRHAVQLSASLFPNRTLQEREIAGIYFLARYGLELLNALYDCMQTACLGHQIVFL
jgi:bacillithiol biosynthesis cysteine-adding enzyme BshC